uniref:Guanylate kinase n=1 Tax=Eiseniibacteriota bacterium TaxID=2212470 RepID=A0A832MKT9_UNCEI
MAAVSQRDRSGAASGPAAARRAARAEAPFGTGPDGRPAAVDPARPFRFEREGLLLVLSGPSGAGKGTLVERLMAARPECVFSISSTTRPRRATEREGVQYEFVSREEFLRRRDAGHFLEWAEVHDHLYGTPVSFVDDQIHAGRVVVLDVDVQGGASVRRARPDSVSVFIFPPSVEALRARLAQRNTDRPEVVQTRLGHAPGELAQYVHYDYLVVNDDLEQALARLVAIVDAERARVSRTRVTQ